MLCKEIIQVIEASYPKEAALDFDNVGLLAGRLEKEVSKVYLALDATEESVDSTHLKQKHRLTSMQALKKLLFPLRQEMTFRQSYIT